LSDLLAADDHVFVMSSSVSDEGVVMSGVIAVEDGEMMSEGTFSLRHPSSHVGVRVLIPGRSET
jgi:hypothetical protein